MNWGIAQVTVRFGPRTALQAVTFDAVPREVRGVVGGDGSGKTTLLRVLAGALMASEGTVQRPGAREIGYMPSGSGVYRDLSVAENLAFVAAAYGVSGADLRARGDDLLQRTGLARVRARLGGELSGGMRQKLGVVLAMLHRPQLLVLDEPTTGVDPLSRADLWRLVAQAAAEGAAVVLSTSYLDEAERATELLFLDRGRPLARGTADDIVLAMPGSLARAEKRPTGADAARSWRRGRTWRVWSPEPAATGVAPDLQDAVTVASLLHELQPHTEGGSAR